MSGVWEDATIASRIRYNRLSTLSSSNITLVSGALSGEIRNVYSVKAIHTLVLGGIGDVKVYLNEVDASGIVTTIGQVSLGSGAENTQMEFAPGQNPDPLKPFYQLQGNARMDIRANISGIVDAVALWWWDVL